MEWIKVSDRKPEHGEPVLITVLRTVPDRVTRRYVEEAQYYEDGFEVLDPYNQETYYEEGVVAWMPYPTPYYGD